MESISSWSGASSFLSISTNSCKKTSIMNLAKTSQSTENFCYYTKEEWEFLTSINTNCILNRGHTLKSFHLFKHIWKLHIWMFKDISKLNTETVRWLLHFLCPRLVKYSQEFMTKIYCFAERRSKDIRLSH